MSSNQRHPRPTPPTVTDGHLGERGSHALAHHALNDRTERGASAVEFALVVIPLLMIVAGIVNFGFVFAQQLALDNAVRAGARAGVVDRGTRHRLPAPSPPTSGTRPPSPAPRQTPISVVLRRRRRVDVQGQRLRREHGRQGHGHVEVPDPVAAAVVGRSQSSHAHQSRRSSSASTSDVRCARTRRARSPSSSGSWRSSSSASRPSPSTSARPTSATGNLQKAADAGALAGAQSLTQGPRHVQQHPEQLRCRSPRQRRSPSRSRSRTTPTAVWTETTWQVKCDASQQVRCSSSWATPGPPTPGSPACSGDSPR